MGTGTCPAMSFLGIVASIFGGSKTMRTTLHNCVCFAGILLFLGAILGASAARVLLVCRRLPWPPAALQPCNLAPGKRVWRFAARDSDLAGAGPTTLSRVASVCALLVPRHT